jgi:hypothetical protein
MSNFHLSPIQDTGGNINFNPSTSNNTDKSLLSIYWTDIIDKPSLCNVSITGIYNDLNINKPWSNLTSYSYIGIGTNNPNFNLDINGSINLTGTLNKNKSPYQNSQWVSIVENSSSNIYFNDGSIGIGSSTFTSNFNLNGNLKIQGNIYPDTTQIYNLGSPDFKWRHLYLSSNSIYLDNISISKTNDNYISIPSVNLNDITISSNFNGNNKTGNLRLNQNSIVIIDDSNNLNKYPVFFNNPYVYSNIVLSNVLSNSSNDIYTKFKGLNTDTIPIPNDTNKRFIVNDNYNRDITFTGILTTSNLITSNINVIGDATTLNTTVYITEKAEVENNTNATAMIVKQINQTKNLLEMYNQSSLSFIINSNGNIGIGGNANNTYKLNIDGSLNTSDELYIKGTNISNIIDLKVSNTSNTLINYNNLINRPLFSSVALNGIYGSLTGTPFIGSGNNFYTSLSGNLGIGTSIINNKLEVLGSINVDGASGEVLIKGMNISNIIDSKVSNTSNTLINYNNLINRPSFATVATSGNYNDLTGKPVYISDYKEMNNIPFAFNTTNNNLIYNTNNGNFGIKTANPNYKFQVNGDLNYTGSLRISNVPISFSYYSNTNITASNGYFSYITNNNSFGYYTFLTSGSITFPQATNCDLLVVGAGGNGGMSAGSGGGGAGEVIYYPNYPFSAGTSNIRVGVSDFNTNNRISRILFNSSSIITALGGGDGGGLITSSPSYSTSGSGTVSGLTSVFGSVETYLSFTAGTTTLTLNSSIICDILIVGGGGGGGQRAGGGGGGGAVIYETNKILNSGSYTINIGNGGNPGAPGTNNGGSNGQDSDIILSGSVIYRAKGGGFGAGDNSTNGIGGSGGSGGGNSSYGRTIGTVGNAVSTNIPSITYGFNGGIGTGGGADQKDYSGGGGGGAGAIGVNATRNANGEAIAGNGGNGLQINITGVNTYYGGGGGGGCAVTSSSAGNGGLGGGGAGSKGAVSASNGTANTGGGGGGSGFSAGTNGISGNGGSGVVIIRFKGFLLNPSSGGSGGGSYLNNNNQGAAGTKWNATYSYSTAGANGTVSVGGNGGSAINGGFTESITGTNLVIGVGGSGASSSSLPVLKNTYGSGGDGNGGLGTQGIVIIKVPLNINNLKYDGSIDYSNVLNRPLINNVFTNSNLININIYNQINFPLGDVSWANEWFLYMGMSPTNISNSFIFWHTSATTNSKWWFNGTTANTNNEISDIRIKKEIIDIINPLSNLMLIKPKEYYLCDEKDYLKKYGIIAQDIKEVLPEFVYTDTDYIANIYSYCNYSEVNSSYFLNINDSSNSNFTFNSSNIQVGDELKLLLNNNENNKEIIIEDLPYHNRYKRRFAVVREIIDEKTIEITQKLELEESEKTNLFIYGKKVDNFLKLDYSSLYTLNIKCNQELYKTYLEQQEKLMILKDRIINLENFN